VTTLKSSISKQDSGLASGIGKGPGGQTGIRQESAREERRERTKRFQGSSDQRAGGNRLSTHGWRSEGRLRIRNVRRSASGALSLQAVAWMTKAERLDLF
jgi:hypothetical protein